MLLLPLFSAAVLTFGISLQKVTGLPGCNDVQQFYRALSVCGLPRASMPGVGCTCSDVYKFLHCLTDYINDKRPLHEECTTSDFKKVIKGTLANTPCLKNMDFCFEYLVRVTIKNEHCNKANKVVNGNIQAADKVIDTLLQDAVHPKVKSFCRDEYERIYYRTYLTHVESDRIKNQLRDKLREVSRGGYLLGSHVYRVSDDVIDRCFEMCYLKDKSKQCFEYVLGMEYHPTEICRPAYDFMNCLGYKTEQATQEPICEVDVLDNHGKRMDLIKFLHENFPQNDPVISQLSLYDAQTCASG
ncbi:uncharacterized protein LOC123540638 [Mercenaria mercenaria]|uniref:uncharacterized protein LOC123540638 n=1 Tax=Mercenaria mercenaria TaxID=6596 RepID=UPI00234F665C|nr:uncharacterized protein LOC123540638 [Mercenaria mercenaria]